MLDHKQLYASNKQQLAAGESVTTPDGAGTVVGVYMRKNTNSGPGCRGYRVKLEDGRVRNYSMGRLHRAN